MKHCFTFTFLLLLCCNYSVWAQTYTITADGDPSDWEANDGTYSGTSLSVHGSGIFNSQFIYKGETGDHRTDGDDPDSNYDITEVRVGASATTLYFLVKFDNITDVGLPAISIAFAASDNLGGFNYIGDGAETGTSGGSLNNMATNVIDIHDPNNDGADPEFNTGSGFENRGVAVISIANNCIEYSILFSQLNGSISQMSTLYFSLISGQDNNTFANSGDTFREIFNSDGIDGMTPGASSGNFFGRSGGIGGSDFDVESMSVDLMEANLLPVEFTKVAINTVGQSHQISWETVSESNNEYFEVERSVDSRNWGKIAFQAGAGNTQQMQSYVATDEHPQSGRNYYRVKQVDYDGAFSYSPIVSAVWRQKPIVSFSPNPVTDQLSISGLADVEEQLFLRLTNSYGQTIWERAYQENTIQMDELPNGIYFLQITSQNVVIATQQVVVQK